MVLLHEFPRVPANPRTGTARPPPRHHIEQTAWPAHMARVDPSFHARQLPHAAKYQTVTRIPTATADVASFARRRASVVQRVRFPIGAQVYASPMWHINPGRSPSPHAVRGGPLVHIARESTGATGARFPKRMRAPIDERARRPARRATWSRQRASTICWGGVGHSADPLTLVRKSSRPTPLLTA
jgi:hypothetical protein